MIAFLFFGWLLVLGPGFQAHLFEPNWCEKISPAESCSRLVVK
jgi:hypothetical protein